MLDGICSFVEVAKGKPLFHKKRIVSSKAVTSKADVFLASTWNSKEANMTALNKVQNS